MTAVIANTGRVDSFNTVNSLVEYEGMQTIIHLTASSPTGNAESKTSRSHQREFNPRCPKFQPHSTEYVAIQ